jgi:hypothetical protein
MYPKTHIDVEVSSGEDDVPRLSASTGRKKVPNGDDVGDGGVSSAEPKAPNPISSDTLKQPHPSTADQAYTDVPPSSRRGHKRPAATRQDKSNLRDDKVMTHIELPPYRSPRSLLDFIAIEIIFGCIFEAFQHIS